MTSRPELRLIGPDDEREGPTEEGRAAMRRARERLRAAPEWQPVRDRRPPDVVE